MKDYYYVTRDNFLKIAEYCEEFADFDLFKRWLSLGRRMAVNNFEKLKATGADENSYEDVDENFYEIIKPLFVEAGYKDFSIRYIKEEFLFPYVHKGELIFPESQKEFDNVYNLTGLFENFTEYLEYLPSDKLFLMEKRFESTLAVLPDDEDDFDQFYNIEWIGENPKNYCGDYKYVTGEQYAEFRNTEKESEDDSEILEKVEQLGEAIFKILKENNYVINGKDFSYKEEDDDEDEDDDDDEDEDEDEDDDFYDENFGDDCSLTTSQKKLVYNLDKAIFLNEEFKECLKIVEEIECIIRYFDLESEMPVYFSYLAKAFEKVYPKLKENNEGSIDLATAFYEKKTKESDCEVGMYEYFHDFLIVWDEDIATSHAYWDEKKANLKKLKKVKEKVKLKLDELEKTLN